MRSRKTIPTHHQHGFPTCDAEAIMLGVARIGTIEMLEAYYRRWKAEIEADERKAEIVEAFRVRKKEVVNGK